MEEMQKEGGEGKAVLSSVKCDVVEAVIIAGSEGRGLFGDFYRKVLVVKFIFL